MTQRHSTAISGFAASVSRLAEAEWVRACEQVRKSAPSIGTVGEFRVLCEGGWLNPMPGDLPDMSINDGADFGKSYATPGTLMTPLPTPADANIRSLVNAAEDAESSTSSSNSRLPNTIWKSSEDQSITEQVRTYPMASLPSSPPSSRDVTTFSQPNKSPAGEPDHGMFTSSNKLVDMVDSTNSNRSSPVVSRPHDSSAVTGSTKPLSGLISTDNQQRLVENPDLTADHVGKLESNATELPRSNAVTSNPELSSTEKNSLEVTKNPNMDGMNARESESQLMGSPENPRPQEGRNVPVGGGLDRRSSVESSNSLVATMRERYDTPPVSYCLPLSLLYTNATV